MRSVVAAALLAVVIAVGVGTMFLAREQAPGTVIQAEIAGVKFAYAHAYARDDATVAGGLADRLAFIASFPAFAPLASKSRAMAPSVVLTLTPKDDGLDPGQRPAKLYARFLTSEALEGPGGLVLRRFEPGSPYDSEELFIAPPDGRTFFARCPKPQTGAPDEACLSVFREGALDVELRYPAALLDQWDTLYEGARALLVKMTSAPVRDSKR